MTEIIVYTAIISALVLFGLLCYGGWLYTERQHEPPGSPGRGGGSDE